MSDFVTSPVCPAPTLSGPGRSPFLSLPGCAVVRQWKGLEGGAIQHVNKQHSPRETALSSTVCPELILTTMDSVPILCLLSSGKGDHTVIIEVLFA